MLIFEKHIPYYYDGTEWKKLKAYVMNNNDEFEGKDTYVMLDINTPILNKFH